MKRGGLLAVLLSMAFVQVPVFRCLSDCQSVLAPLWSLDAHHCHDRDASCHSPGASCHSPGASCHSPGASCHDEGAGEAGDLHCVGHSHGCEVRCEHGETHGPGDHAVLAVHALPSADAPTASLLASGLAFTPGPGGEIAVPARPARDVRGEPASPPPARRALIETTRLLL